MHYSKGPGEGSRFDRENKENCDNIVKNHVIYSDIGFARIQKNPVVTCLIRTIIV